MRAIINTSLGDKPLRVVQSCVYPVDMFAKLIERYSASTTANKISVMKNLINTRYDGTKEMGEYISEMESVFNKLAVMGSPMSDDMQVAFLLVSLSSEESLSGRLAAVKTMEASKATWDYVSGRLLEEARSQKLAESAEMKASSTTAASARQKTDRSNIWKGHMARDWKRKSSPSFKKGPTKPRYRATIASGRKYDATFIVDSGCTQHITNDFKNFSEVYDIKPIRIHVSDGRVVKATQEGSILFKMYQKSEKCPETQLMLNRVLYIPEAGVNMISCSQLESAEISTVIENGECLFIDRRDE